ncbi:Na+/H+ antiporter NhaA [Altericroceibacterium endophyticum]|uniref:Na(+)/H(+) antiporter NhaA n=1 Tax=Altericroceibacterium endophyticum TaxID=1808508 RepID=A0A6I4T5R3_9SPHN|nr:Na+/H+ antiporter NhaA [Altericroceibacterium endophyticum]MXO66544.1 Na+/H+ antiporter NhaA [Altericroceibacterium endophyticum]
MPQPKLIAAAVRPFKALFVSDASEGILLILVAASAMVIANTPLAHSYHELFHGALAWTPIAKLYNLHLWINDGLMAIFFFVVGLEVKRELISGNLADPNARRLPVLAAIAGMAAPALVFFTLIGGDANLHRGWAIPAATDIAFAMGVLGLLGSRVPAPLRLFLLTVAIVDDVGAVLIIALFYTANIKLAWLIASMVVVGVLIAMNRMRVSKIWPYIVVALVLWFCVLNSGVHATIAGVVAALTIPMHRRDGNSLLENIEHGLVGWNAYLIVPLFGFANAGIAFAGLGMEQIFAPLPLAVAAGLVFGKQIGIFSSIIVADRLGFAPRPQDASWLQIWGTSVLCGIGFTMSLFISGLAFSSNLLIEEAKIGIVGGSVVSALLGFCILRFAPGKKGVTES